MAEKILLVDDDPDIIEFLQYNLEKEGYIIYSASNGIEAINVVKEHSLDLIVLDVMMPEMDGIEACIEIRKIPKNQHSKVVFLTARNEDYSQIAGLEAGADDYISKPIKPRVFVAKVKALLRKVESTSSPIETEEVNGVKIDREKYIVERNGEQITFPKKEFELLALLISKPDTVFTREQILSSVWGEDVIVGGRTVDVHIRKLREKLGNNYITTLKGIGYKFES